MNKGGKDKRSEFLKLAAAARACRLCPAMCDKTAVLSELNGRLDPKVLFIAEAPGRQGADRTRRPFDGDKSGVNFSLFLASIGLGRDEIFITNTVLCSPRSETGANRRPAKKEIKNCAEFLAETIKVIDPRVVATLGSVALEALKTIEYHQITLKSDAARIFRWNERLLVPLYHPSPQVIASRRRVDEQLEDYRSVAEAIGRAGSSES
jgi:uracil-DNA glycosylase